MHFPDWFTFTDTSCILAWLIEQGYEVVAFMADVGQEEVLLSFPQFCDTRVLTRACRISKLLVPKRSKLAPKNSFSRYALHSTVLVDIH